MRVCEFKIGLRALQERWELLDRWAVEKVEHWGRDPSIAKREGGKSDGYGRYQDFDEKLW